MAGDLLPYFKVYPAETLADERFSGWTVAERGAWFSLILHAWVNGSIPADEVSLARILHVDATAMRSLWQGIADRFIPHPDLPEGRLTSRRLEEEREDAIARAEAGKKGAKSRWAKGNRRDATAMRPQCDRNAVPSVVLMPTAQPSPAQRSPAQPTGSASAESGLAGEERRLLVFREALGQRLGLPGPIAVGKDPDEVVEFFQSQREAVGDEPLLTECCDLAAKSSTGPPAHLSWFVGWLKKLPVPKAVNV
jgi:uncharacterized protein YdaU (DUF1376 family)